MKTVLITGCSSGFGLETAKYFLERDWNVIATMRTPREDLLPSSENLRIIPLDVTNAESIRAAVETAGPIDVLVNNAGIGLLNAVEGTPMEMIRDIFETNTFGVMAMTQAVLPQFRERGAGVIVNVTSSVTLKSLPLVSVYTASKAAINAFTESMALELEQFGVRVRVVLPGRSPTTRFAENGRESQRFVIPEAYADLAQQFMAGWAEADHPTTRAEDVAEAIWLAATDPSTPIRLPAGADAIEWAKSAKAAYATS
jgi:NAD(P)-dependent dehydrogenase (short-subunit alcohol dehydrogenase family)